MPKKRPSEKIKKTYDMIKVDNSLWGLLLSEPDRDVKCLVHKRFPSSG